MISTSPLKGKKVLIPRAKGQAKSFSKMVEGYGGIPVEIPLLAFRPLESKELQSFANEISTYDWIIFTSKVTVETFFLTIKQSEEIFPKVAVIGEKTEQALRRRGIYVDFKPNVYVAEEFVKEFLPIVHEGERVFIPKGNLARDLISTSLKDIGAEVKEAIVYETYFPKESEVKLTKMLTEKSMDILTFTSPSTVEHFMKTVHKFSLQNSLQNCVVACIGRVTKEKAEENGLLVHVTPEVYTVKDMLQCVMEFLDKKI